MKPFDQIFKRQHDCLQNQRYITPALASGASVASFWEAIPTFARRLLQAADHCPRNDMTLSYASRSLPKFFFQSAFCSAVFRADSPIFLNDLRFFIACKIFSARSSTSPSQNNQPLTPSSIHSLFPGMSDTKHGSPLANASNNE